MSHSAAFVHSSYLPPWAFRNLELWINSGHPQPSRLFHSEKPFVGSLAVFVLPPNILRGRFIVIAAVLCSAAATECLHHTWDIQRIETVDPVIYCTPAPSSGDLLNGVKRYVIPVWQTYNWLHARIHAFIKSYFLQLLHSPFYSLKHLAAAKTALIFCVIRAAICHCHQCHLSLPWWPQRCLAMSMMMRWLQTQGNVEEVLCSGQPNQNFCKNTESQNSPNQNGWNWPKPNLWPKYIFWPK